VTPTFRKFLPENKPLTQILLQVDRFAKLSWQREVCPYVLYMRGTSAGQVRRPFGSPKLRVARTNPKLSLFSTNLVSIEPTIRTCVSRFLRHSRRSNHTGRGRHHSIPLITNRSRVAIHHTVAANSRHRRISSLVVGSKLRSSVYTWLVASSLQPRIFRIVLMIAALGLSSGCRKLVKARVICLKTDITTAANQNHPVAVDILLVRDKDLIKKVMSMTAGDWFEKRAQVMRDYPDAKDLVVFHREWVPGQVIPCSSLALEPMPKATVLFANYFGKGDHRARLVNGKSATIRLLDDDVQILPLAECTRTSCPTDTR
jgi:type VI secretion system protein